MCQSHCQLISLARRPQHLDITYKVADRGRPGSNVCLNGFQAFDDFSKPGLADRPTERSPLDDCITINFPSDERQALVDRPRK